jgi:exodeoxyribonuclease VII small subunit
MMQTYEQSVRRLEAIVAELGNDAKPLSEAVVLFEEGLACLRNAEAQLADIDAKVKVLVEGTDGSVQARDL